MLSLFTLSEIVELKIFTTGQLSNADLWVQWGLVDGWNVIPDRKRDPENNIHYWFAHIRHAISVVTLYDDTSLSVATLSLTGSSGCDEVTDFCVGFDGCQCLSIVLSCQGIHEYTIAVERVTNSCLL